MSGEEPTAGSAGELSVRHEPAIPAVSGAAAPGGAVSGAPAPGGQPDPSGQAGLRASHEDRDRVVELLRVAAGDGRLTADELDQRLEAALTARTYSELAVLTTDLPVAASRPATAPPVPPVPPAEVKDLMRIAVTSGSDKRDGHWIVPRAMEVRVNSGHVKLDLRKAEIVVPVLQLDAEVKSGHLAVITRPGIVVDTGDVEVRSGHVRVRTHRGPTVPVVLRIRISGHVGSGSLSVRPPRRTLWQWLLRRPVEY